MKYLALVALALAAALLPACGGPPQKLDGDAVRRHADDADRDLDRAGDDAEK